MGLEVALAERLPAAVAGANTFHGAMSCDADQEGPEAAENCARDAAASFGTPADWSATPCSGLIAPTISRLQCRSARMWRNW